MKKIAKMKRTLWLLPILAATMILVTRAGASREPLDVRAPLRLADPFAIYGPAAPDAAPKSAAASTDLTETNCRYGLAFVYGDSLEWIPTLNAGWYVSFSAIEANVDSAEFVPVIKVRQDMVNGQRLATATIFPPLTETFVDDQGREQAGLGRLARNNPGRLWLVGNEPDVDNMVQGNTMPDIYAYAYHDVYNYIKSVDPTAKVAIAGLSMMSPGRVQYLDIVWNIYQATYGTEMPVDVWNMHLYVLEERNPFNPKEYGDGKIALGTDPNLAKWSSIGDPYDCPLPDAPDTPENDPRPDVYCRSEHDSVRIFTEQVMNMRTWMKAHGQQDKPLIISEFSLLYPHIESVPPEVGCEVEDEFGQCFTPQRVTDFLHGSVQMLENTTDPELGYPQDGYRLVQQWLWYSIITQQDWSGGSSNLIVDNYGDFVPGSTDALTQMGQAFLEEATARPISANLAAGEVVDVVAHPEYPEVEGSAEISVSFRNSDIKSIIQPFTVTFYADQGLTEVIGSVEVDPQQTGIITGCKWDGRNTEKVSIMWDGLTPGIHPYWAKIDSAGVIGEATEGDNVSARGTVRVNLSASYLSLISAGE